MYLRRGASRGLDPHTGLAEAAQTGLPVEGLVTAVNKGGLEVTVGGVRAFCPVSQRSSCGPSPTPRSTSARSCSSASRASRRIRRGAGVVLSRRALLEEEQRSRAVETREKLRARRRALRAR